MQTLLFQNVRAQLNKGCEWLRPRAKDVSKELYVAGGFCLLVVMLVAVHTAFSGKNAILRVRVQHNFREARIEVSVDGETAYTGKLTGSMHKKFGLVPDGVQGNWSQSIPVTAGQHRIGVRVVGDDGSDHAQSTSSKFVNNGERDLSVVARHADLSTTWLGNSNGVRVTEDGTPADPQPSWLSRYASTLFLTIAGSIVSALSGYAIRELPGWLRNRSEESKAEASQTAAAGR